MRKISFGLILLFALNQTIQAKLFLPAVFCDNMVLQQKQAVPVWGKADPGEKIVIKFSDQQMISHADELGNWQVRLLPMDAGGPFEMTIHADSTVKFSNVMIGEVWLCSGQSNMEMGISLVEGGKQAIAGANHPDIRLFHIRQKTSGYPIFDVDTTGPWRVCTTKNMEEGGWGGFSAIAYFFAREIQNELKVPVGVIDSSWGGTRIEPWTPVEGIASIPSMKNHIKLIDESDLIYQKRVLIWLDKIESWVKSVRKAHLTKPKQPLPLKPAWPIHPLDHYSQPTSIYNAMVHPLIPYGIRGALWYQGETNLMDGTDGISYYEMMKALINGWRQIWNQGDFPFYFVQLAPRDYGPTRVYDLPQIWEAQTSALQLPNTGMAVTNDLVYDLKNIHPINKLDVGKRLALWALANTYGKRGLVFSGPIYKNSEIKGDKICIYYDHIGSGLASRDGKPLNWFEVAGKNNKFVKAEALIDGETVVVSNPQVPAPKSVRFAWHQLAQPNLINKEGLPAAAFRTSK